MKDVLDMVETLSSQWSLLTTKLGVKQSSLDIIKHNHPGDAKMCLYEALGEWLRLNYDHQRHGRPSWRKLAEAVKSLDYRLFERIAETWKHEVTLKFHDNSYPIQSMIVNYKRKKYG